jgi:hypothetical protein
VDPTVLQLAMGDKMAGYRFVSLGVTIYNGSTSAVSVDGNALTLTVDGRTYSSEVWATGAASFVHGMPYLTEAILQPGASMSGCTGFMILGIPYVGDVLLLPDQLWGNYRMVFGVRRGAKIDTYPLFDLDHGFDVEGLRQAVQKHPDIDECVAIGPPVMMKGCAEATRPHKIHTIVSLNPVMVDGTGMCGGCRVKLSTGVKFACVDGPDFDGHLVDFDDLVFRLQRYKATEREATERFNESCRLRSQVP